MSKLQYKTRGMSNPQGKSRVYFCCHPKDFDLYFEALSEDVLKLYNCAVWYESEPDAVYEEEELAGNLAEMNLFLVPVTTRFLTQENRARDLEFAIAQKHHIPILPLMQEKGLEELFNKRCGDLHALNREANEQDATALSYEEKFKKFLDSVLVGDEMLEKIRNAFDAYIFLSYRKKDRQYAQKLMRMIHRNDFCRDIAIWYDEFLVPGENFNDAIEAAMDKCRLLALAVTPNLVNEPNYVQSVEYPEAVKKGKAVLPVEMKELSESEQSDLKEQYPHIAEPASGKQEGILTRQLKKQLRSIALQEHAGDAEHDFFIGLAYLNGIDVERDTERGYRLIEGASRSGLKEATVKLAQMYHTGDGVKRDYFKEIEWLEVLAGQWKESWEDEKTEDNGNEYFWSMIDLGDAWEAVGRLEKAADCYETARLCADETGDQRNRSVSLNRLGDIRKSQGNLGEAESYYVEALAINRELVKETGTVESRRGVSISLINLGDIQKPQGKWSEAESYYEKALAIARELFRETGTTESRRDVSASLGRLGDAKKLQENLGEAETYYEEALGIFRELFKESGTAESRRDVSASLSNLGVVKSLQGKWSEAETYYEEAFAIDRELFEETGTVESRRNFSVSLINLGYVKTLQGHLGEAETYYEEALAIRRELFEETGTVESRRDLSVGLSFLGEIQKSQRKWSEAEGYYKEALAIDRELFEETGTTKSHRDVSVSLSNLGEIQKSQGKWSEAETCYEEALGIFREFFRETGTIESRRNVLAILSNLGDIKKVQGKWSEAEGYYEEALGIFRELVKETGTVESRRDVSLSLSKLGDIKKVQGKWSEAEGYYEEALGIFRELFKETGTIQSADDLGKAFYFYAGICADMKNMDKAASYYKESLRIFELLYQQTSNSMYQRCCEIVKKELLNQ